MLFTFTRSPSLPATRKAKPSPLGSWLICLMVGLGLGQLPAFTKSGQAKAQVTDTSSAQDDPAVAAAIEAFAAWMNAVLSGARPTAIEWAQREAQMWRDGRAAAPFVGNIRQRSAIDQMLRLAYARINVLAAEIPAIKMLTAAEAEAFTTELRGMIAQQDADNAQFLRISFASGESWPALSEHGADVAGRAWLLIGHAVTDPDLQATALEVMTPLLELNEVNPANYARLSDKVALARGQLQRFGTQGVCKDGAWAPFPIADAQTLERDRAAFGLAPFAEAMTTSNRECATER